jgi:hypothetical protein
VFAGLGGAAIVTVLVKLFSGIALAPLAVIALMVFTVVMALRLRILRTG